MPEKHILRAASGLHHVGLPHGTTAVGGAAVVASVGAEATNAKEVGVVDGRITMARTATVALLVMLPRSVSGVVRRPPRGGRRPATLCRPIVVQVNRPPRSVQRQMCCEK